VPIDARAVLWDGLEKAGYDLANADYKAGGDLKPVTLSFVVTLPMAMGADRELRPRLQAVTVTSSSGDPAVDAAVAYGFSKAGFYNVTDGTIGGTFTYRFAK
jgi:hypothetical protein